MNIELTAEEIDAAIRAAQEARAIEGEILDYADSHDGTVTGGLDHRHMGAFVEGMLTHIGGSLRKRSADGRILEVELPEERVGRYPEFGMRRIVQLGLDPAISRRRRDVFPLDFRLSFTTDIARLAKDRRFDGMCAATPGVALGAGWLSLWRVRWQDAEGMLLEEAQLPVIGSGRDPVSWRRWSDEEFGELLLSPLRSASQLSGCARGDIEAMDAVVHRIVAADATDRRHPGALFLAAALGGA